ncbi:Dabb family protein [Paracoccaceae bacterium GXU_MW_L88]
MIRHFVFFSARDAQDRDAVLKGLSILKDIPSAAHVEVSPNMKLDSLSSEVDVVVYAEFDDLAALEAFKAHDLYEESIRLVRPIRELRFVADIEA